MKCKKDCEWRRKTGGCWKENCIRNSKLSDFYIKRKKSKRRVKK